MKRFSAQQFTSEADLQFSPSDYSMFKFGCKDVARRFGRELGEKFCASPYFEEIKTSLAANPEQKIIVLSSPYLFIPTATFAMKNFFVNVFQHHAYQHGLKPCLEARLYRAKSYKEDYGEMSKEQRYNTMQNDIFHCDKSFLDGNICLFLDDIVITGGHEHRIKMMIEHFDLKIDAYFLYYAELTNPLAPPNIENYLNYAYVKTLLDLDKIIKNQNFTLNTRTVKLILDAPHEDCRTFLNYQRNSFLHKLYTFAIGNSYHTIPDYQRNFLYLSQLLEHI